MYRGSAHQDCNLNFKLSDEIPVIFHNLRGYYYTASLAISNDEHITDEAYHHAQKVWQKFKLKNMGQYHDLYLMSDILSLAAVFENKLDPCHYFTSPGLNSLGCNAADD